MAIDPELLKLLMGMQGNRPQSLTPNSLLGSSGSSPAPPQGQSPLSPQPQSNPWSTGLDIGSTAMQTAAPVAGMLLSRPRPGANMPSPVNVGSRSPFQPQSPFTKRPEDDRRSMLIRQLLGR